MKLSERIRRDRQRYAALSPSEKRAFLWDYYKIPILALVCAVLLGGIALLEGLNSRSVAVYAVLVNAAPDTEAAQTCLEDLLTDSGMDLKGKRVDADVRLSLGRENQESEDAQTVQVLAALFGVSGLDFLLRTKKFLTAMRYRMPLRTFPSCWIRRFWRLSPMTWSTSHRRTEAVSWPVCGCTAVPRCTGPGFTAGTLWWGLR